MRRVALFLFALIVFPAIAEEHAVRFVVRQDSGDRYQSTVIVTIIDTASAKSSTIRIEPRLLSKRQGISLPPGSYELNLQATHDQPVHRSFRIADRDVDLGPLALVPNSVVSGTLRDSAGSAIVGALVTAGPNLAAKSDAIGDFAFEIADDWPSSIVASYPGLATKHVALPKTHATTKLPPITLTKGSRITIDIESLSADSAVELSHETRYNHYETLQTITALKAAPRVVFDDVEKGSYVVVLRGTGPLQRLATPLDVGEGENVARTIRIEPIDVEIAVHRGTDVVANALVGVLSDRSRWSAELQTDADGIARSEAWERGDFVFAVRASAEGAPSLLPDRIEGQSHTRIDLHLSERIVEGHLFDGDNGAPVANARVELESANDDGTTAQMVARTDSEGAFAFEGLHDGTQAIVADASSYVRSEATKVHVDAATPRRSIRINVSHGVARPLRITTRGGVPIRNATVIAIVGSDV